MSYPEVMIAGTPSREFEQHVPDRLLRGRWNLGTLMMFQDGRKFRYAKNAAVALVAGHVVQSAANVANHILQTPAIAGAVGDKRLKITMGATAVVADEYMDGYLSTNLGTGFGFTYGVGTHALSAGSTDEFFPLSGGYTLQAGIPTTANSVSLVHNPFRAVIDVPVTTTTGVIVGVACVSAAASQHTWIQRSGIATVLGTGTLVLGNMAGNISVAGTTEPLTGVAGEQLVGLVQLVATTTNMSVLFLTLE